MEMMEKAQDSCLDLMGKSGLERGGVVWGGGVHIPEPVMSFPYFFSPTVFCTKYYSMFNETNKTIWPRVLIFPWPN